MKAAPVIPKIPLQELKLNTDANPWFCSKPIDPVASNINLALIFLKKYLNLLLVAIKLYGFSWTTCYPIIFRKFYLYISLSNLLYQV